MVIKIREIRPKMRGRLWWEGFTEKEVLTLEWNRDGVMHSENGDIDSDVDEPVRER